MKKLALCLPMLALTAAEIPDRTQLQKLTSRFAPTELHADVSKLSPADRQAVVKLIEASRVLNDIFLDQLWSGNQAMYAKLKRDSTPLGKARLHYFWINKGPWSDIDDHTSFLPGAPPKKLPGANFYPEDNSSPKLRRNRTAVTRSSSISSVVTPSFTLDSGTANRQRQIGAAVKAASKRRRVQGGMSESYRNAQLG
jgi:hypothetical protein